MAFAKKRNIRESENGEIFLKANNYNNKDYAIVEPPPPKKSRPSTLPPPAIWSGYNSVSSGYNSPPVSLKEYQCLCLEETNRLRAQLGLKPLRFEDIPEFREGGRKGSPEGRWY